MIKASHPSIDSNLSLFLLSKALKNGGPTSVWKLMQISDSHCEQFVLWHGHHTLEIGKIMLSLKKYMAKNTGPFCGLSILRQSQFLASNFFLFWMYLQQDVQNSYLVIFNSSVPSSII